LKVIPAVCGQCNSAHPGSALNTTGFTIHLEPAFTMINRFESSPSENIGAVATTGAGQVNDVFNRPVNKYLSAFDQPLISMRFYRRLRRTI
jgi:hypothetical protein